MAQISATSMCPATINPARAPQLPISATASQTLILSDKYQSAIFTINKLIYICASEFPENSLCDQGVGLCGAGGLLPCVRDEDSPMALGSNWPKSLRPSPSIFQGHAQTVHKFSN